MGQCHTGPYAVITLFCDREAAPSQGRQVFAKERKCKPRTCKSRSCTRNGKSLRSGERVEASGSSSSIGDAAYVDVGSILGGTHREADAAFSQIATKSSTGCSRHAGVFTLAAVTMNGKAVIIEDLRSADKFASLVTKVEHAFEVPANCVQLCCGERLFAEECRRLTLAELGICEAACIMCVFKDPVRVELLGQLRQGDQKSQYSAMRKLLDLGLGALEVRDTVNFLERLIRNAHWWKSGNLGREQVTMYQQTAKGLGKLGVEAATAIPTLRRHARDIHVAQVAADAIGEMGDAGVKALSEMVLSSLNTPSIAASRTLQQLGAAALPAKAALQEAAASPDRDVQCAALDALRAIREKAAST